MEFLWVFAVLIYLKPSQAIILLKMNKKALKANDN